MKSSMELKLSLSSSFQARGLVEGGSVCAARCQEQSLRLGVSTILLRAKLVWPRSDLPSWTFPWNFSGHSWTLGPLVTPSSVL